VNRTGLDDWLSRGDPVGLATFASARQGRATIVPAHLTTGESNVDQNSYTTASVTPTANALQLLWVVQTATTVSGPTSITGNGLTWVEVNRKAAGTSALIVLYRAMGSAPSPGTIAIAFGAGDATTGCHWSLVEYRNVDTSGTNGSGAIVQNTANSASANTTCTIALSAFEHSNNVHAYGVSHAASEATTPATGFQERGDVSHTLPSRGLETADAVNDNSADPSWTTSSASIWVAVEVKAG
jgi:hypothetical protein